MGNNSGKESGIRANILALFPKENEARGPYKDRLRKEQALFSIKYTKISF